MIKQFTGTVVSTKMQKTIVVLVERKLQHPRYRKIIIRHKRYKAHCENPNVKEGDVVTIMETKPMSKDKKFILVGDMPTTEKKVKTQKAVKQEKETEPKKEVAEVKNEVKAAKPKKATTRKPRAKKS